MAFNSSVAECVVINKAIKIVVPKKTKKKYFFSIIERLSEKIVIGDIMDPNRLKII
ncbi:MAG: hypothetical protein L6U99_08340 [Clostridium sp.]|nr:MAG: hypothetical protein L6U99_08340 [Clostridium sp.]